MAVLQQVHSGTMEERPSKREILHGKLAGKLAAEGMVLLKNEGVLPLKTSAPAGLFGGGAVRTVKGGTGSGDVNNRENISVYRGLKEAGVPITSEEWLIDYEKRYEAARNVWKEKVLKDAEKMENPFDAYALNPFSMPEGRSISEEDVKGALTALYVISRISGEGKDRSRTEGDYYLSRQEREDILFLNRQNMPIVLILNVGAPVELTDILQEAENIKGILLISLPGQEGGHAAANVLLGKSVPGGRLTATWAKRYEDYPSAEEFGALNGNLETEEYREGIYVGYRYFSSFGVQPLFPFGYGLSYTEFSVDFDRLEITETGAELIVTVKNIGKIYASREVVQVYVTLPQKEMEEAECSAADEERIGLSYLFGPQGKECYRLAGFARTGLLQPGESQQLRVVTDQKQMAGFSEEQQAWIVEKGSYGLWLGKHAESLEPAAILTVPESVVLERTERIRPAQKVLEEFAEPKSVKENVSKWLKMAKKQKTPEFLFHPRGEQNRETKYSVTPMPGGQGGSKEELKGKEQELSVEELIPLLYGNVVKGASTLGSSGVRVPGSAGETTETLEHKYGVRSLIMADGPAGLRLRQSYQVDRKSDSVYGVGVLGSLENGFLEEMEFHEDADTYYQYCTAFPVGTALAQTWDVDLMREFGRAVALEMEEFYVDLWLAPGMNIQRNPLCGRNFEYYSEDPFLSGKMAAAVVSGVQADGNCGVTVKHFACNNQEDNRMGVNVRVSERALREIYLRGFEIAVKKSRPVAMMSAYNLVNGVHAANSRDLCTVVAREEWRFEGMIISDWNTTVPEDGSIPWQCVYAGNDIIMPGNPKDDEDIRKAYEEGKLSEEIIRRSAERVIGVIRRLSK